MTRPYNKTFNPDNPAELRTPAFASFCQQRQNLLQYHATQSEAIRALRQAGLHRNLIRVYARKESTDEWYEICRESLIRDRLIVPTPVPAPDVLPTYTGEPSGILIDHNEPSAGGSNP